MGHVAKNTSVAVVHWNFRLGIVLGDASVRDSSDFIPVLITLFRNRGHHAAVGTRPYPCLVVLHFWRPLAGLVSNHNALKTVDEVLGRIHLVQAVDEVLG